MSGVPLDFSAADLAASVAGYDPVKWKAPIVIGHPAIDAPAYGWVEQLTLDADGIHVEPTQVDEAFADVLREGKFRNISVRFFPPAAHNNPVPGIYYLRHVGVLGATPPAVMGLKPIEFSADDDAECITIEFSMDDDAADSPAVPPEGGNGQKPALPSPITPEEPHTVTPEEVAALHAQNATLAAQVATLQAQQAETARLALHADNAAFADGLVKAGRLIPGIAPLIVATLDHLAESESPMFGEGDAAQPLPAALKAALSAAPVVIDFAERGAGEDETATVAVFAAPGGYEVDPAALDLHRRALAHQVAHQTDYLAAVKAVSAHA